MVSYAFIRLVYDRFVFGYIDLRRKSLLEIVIIPVGLTILFWLSKKLMKFRITQC